MASFSQQIAAWSKKTDIKIDNAVKAIRIQISGGIIRRTPVLDSGLVQSWIATTGEPSPDLVEASGSGMSESAAKAKAISDAVKMAEQQIDGIFWITNNQPYVRRVEYEGWSPTKAPQGMVRITLMEFRTGMEALLKNV